MGNVAANVGYEGGTYSPPIGGTQGSRQGRQSVVVASDGTLGAVYLNEARTSVVLATSADSGATWTTRATVPMAAAITDSFGELAISQFANNDVAIAHRTTDQYQIQYIRITWGTWAPNGWETAVLLSGTSKIGNIDIDVSDGGAVGLAYHVAVGTTRLDLRFTTRNTGGAWTTPNTTTVYNNASYTRREFTESVSVLGLGLSGSIRQWVIAHGWGNSNSDNGVTQHSIRVTESSGALSGTAFQAVGFGAVDSGALPRDGERSGRWREARLQRGGLNQYTLMIATRQESLARVVFSYWTATLNAGTWANVRTGSTTLPAVHYSRLYPRFGFSSNVDGSVLYFRYAMFGGSGDRTERVASVIIQVGALSGSDKITSGVIPFEVEENTQVMTLNHGARRNLSLSRMEYMALLFDPVNGINPMYVGADVVPDPGGVSAVLSLLPSNGSTNQSANPTLRANVRLGTKFSPSAYRAVFQFSRSPSWTSSTFYYQNIADDQRLIEGTDAAGATKPMGSTLDSSFNLGAGTWYYRAWIQNAIGVSGAASAAQTFIVGHPPVAIQTGPSDGITPWVGGVVNFAWTFTDPSSSDYQTAYRVIVYEAGTTNVVHSSGKVTSSNKYYSATLGGAYKDVALEWTVEVWDSDDTSTESIALVRRSLLVSDPVVVAITAPTANQVLATGVPTVTFTFSTGGGRRLREFTVTLMKGSDIIWSKRVTKDAASGSTHSIKVDQGFIVNNSAYSVLVTAIDNGGLSATSSVIPFTVTWVPPNAPTDVAANVTSYNTDDLGYIEVTWSDSARDTGFRAWRLMRKADLVDIAGTVLEAGEWEEVFVDYSVGSSYYYRDFFAPSGYKLTYGVIQSVNRIGQDIDSLIGEASPVVPMSDGYWLIEPNANGVTAECFKLSIVTGDSFTDEQEESEFIVIGRGRVVNKGQRLGAKGTLDVQLRNTGGTTARQKRLRLVELQRQTRKLYLRNPFGDIFRVSVGAMSISRLAGTGRDEFCDVSIPYSEVS